MTAYTNDVYPDVYPGIRKMEAETRGVTRPNLVLAVNGHVGLGVAVRNVVVDPVTLVSRAANLRRACDAAGLGTLGKLSKTRYLWIFLNYKQT